MTRNDLLLLAILAIGACWINWNVIKNSFFSSNSSSPLTQSKKNSTYLSSSKKEVSEKQVQ